MRSGLLYVCAHDVKEIPDHTSKVLVSSMWFMFALLLHPCLSHQTCNPTDHELILDPSAKSFSDTGCGLLFLVIRSFFIKQNTSSAPPLVRVGVGHRWCVWVWVGDGWESGVVAPMQNIFGCIA